MLCEEPVLVEAGSQKEARRLSRGPGPRVEPFTQQGTQERTQGNDKDSVLETLTACGSSKQRHSRGRAQGGDLLEAELRAVNTEESRQHVQKREAAAVPAAGWPCERAETTAEMGPQRRRKHAERPLHCSVSRSEGHECQRLLSRRERLNFSSSKHLWCILNCAHHLVNRLSTRNPMII